MTDLSRSYQQQQDPFVGTLKGALGGLGQGLAALAQHKINDLKEKKELHQRSQFWKSTGLRDEVAHAFASAPIEIQKQLLDRLEGVEFDMQPQQNQQQPYQQMQQQQEPMDSQMTEPNQLMGQQEPTQPQATQEDLFDSQIKQVAQQQPRKIKLGSSSANKKLHAEQFQATAGLRHDILQRSKSSRQTLKDLSRLEELSQEGKLDTPGYAEFLERSGFDIPALMNPESEEFKKIQQNFLKGAKEYFGGRISNYEVEQFLKTIPSLSQSPEGRQRVIANLKNVARADMEYKNAMKEVVNENGGIPPYDLEEKIDDKIDKRLDRLSEEFKKDLKKPAPKGQNKLITALQAGAGSLIGAPGKILSKVGGMASNILA